MYSFKICDENILLICVQQNSSFVQLYQALFNFIYLSSDAAVSVSHNKNIPICLKAIKIIVQMQPNKYQWMRRQFLNAFFQTIQKLQCIRKQLWMETKKINHQISEKQSGIWLKAQPKLSIRYDFHPYIVLFYKVKFHWRT